MTTELSKKSGKGLSDRVVSELTIFFTVRPGHEEELRAACQRFSRMLHEDDAKALKSGLRDLRHVIFDNGQRLLLTTTFDTDWDPYIDDVLVVYGLENWADWGQHTVEAEFLGQWVDQVGRERLTQTSGAELEQVVRATSAELKAILQSVQVQATAYWNALGDQTMREIRKAVRVEQAFQQVLDNPEAAQALQQPALKPLLEQAAD